MENKNRRTPAEVAAEASVEHTGKGVFNQVKGNVREAWGKLVGNPKHQVGGKIDQLKGRVQTGLGKFEAKEAELESRGSRIDDDDTQKT
jgi:uncharacterized protein YjbJ (UPF0337 family)